MDKKQIIVITDADAIVALANENDSNHQKAKKISIGLETINAKVITPITAFAEAITVLKRRLQKNILVKDILNQCKDGSLPITEVSEDIIPSAISFFDPDSSKKDTFFDAIIAAMAQKYHADAVFSFDSWFRKKGFKLSEELTEIFTN